MTDLLHRLRSLFRRKTVEAGMDEELRFHLERETEKNLNAGMSCEASARQARLALGGLEQVKEEYREARGVLLAENLLQDLRYGVRMLRRSPGFAATAILTLALGIGATTAIFSVVNAVVLKPLPFPTANRLVQIESVILATGKGSGVASYPDFLDWRAQSHVFDAMAVFRTGDFTLVGTREPMRLQGAVVSAQLFSLLGITPVLGRSFLPVEDSPGAANGSDPVILSYGLWQSEFGSDASILGRPIQLGNRPFTVVGVMPKEFQFPIQAETVELWTTIAVDAVGGPNAMTVQRGAHYLEVIGSLKPGVTAGQAQSEMITIAASLNKQHPESKPRSVRIVPEVQYVAGDARIPFLVLLGAVGCVLLIVCANVANLLLARATSRHKEMAVRAALGASRRRATCQLLTESTLLALLGGALGVALAFSSLRFLIPFIPVEIPRLDGIGLDAGTLTFALLVSLITGMLFGFAPALQVGKISLTDPMKVGRGSASEGKGHQRLRGALVVSEVALAVVLLVVAGLLMQTFLHLMRADPGFDPHNVLTFHLDSPTGMPGPQFFRQVVARISTLPGASSASAVASLPLTGNNIRSGFEIEGESTPEGSRPIADFNAIEPGYFRTLGIARIQGRDFTEFDDLKSTPVAIVNRTLAQRFFPNEDPIGKHVRPGIGNGQPGGPPMREIVGVIADVKQGELGVEALPEIYAPLAQSAFSPMTIVLRSSSDPRHVIAAARRELASLSKNVPIYDVKTLDECVADSLAQSRFSTFLLSSFAALAVFLASLGVYGVISYVVLQRTHEIGVRVALGAEAGDVVRWVLARGLLLAIIGVTIGLTASFGLVQLVSGMLYGTRTTDPVTFAVAPLVLLGVAGLASYIPARRAARVDPIVALRHE